MSAVRIINPPMVGVPRLARWLCGPSVRIGCPLPWCTRNQPMKRGPITSPISNAVATAPTRTTPGLANSILSSVNEDTVYTTPQTNLDQFNATVDGLTAIRAHAQGSAASAEETGSELGEKLLQAGARV